jgi:hypothetical protein
MFLCKFYANAGGKRLIERQPLLVQYKQQANPLLSMHNYAPLVISRNDKNMQLTLLSQHKLELIARNTLFGFGCSSNSIHNGNTEEQNKRYVVIHGKVILEKKFI